MPRAQSTDPLQGFRFKVVDANVDGGSFLTGGFATATLPEFTMEAAEYKNGDEKFKRKFPGIPTVNDVTLTRGVVKTNTEFYDWLKAALNGQEYRSDVTIQQFHRESDAEPAFVYTLKNAFPIRVKPAGDFDANTSDINLAEVDIAYEEFEVAAG